MGVNLVIAGNDALRSDDFVLAILLTTLALLCFMVESHMAGPANPDPDQA